MDRQQREISHWEVEEINVRPKRTHVSHNNLILIGIPKELHLKSMNDFETYNDAGLQEVKNIIVQYINELHENFQLNKGLLLYGSNGTGKTFIASMVLKEAYINRYSARRITFVDYINRYTQIWRASKTEEKEALEEAFYTSYKAVEFLCLEEVGKEIDNKISAPILEDALRYREDRGLVTLICTNLDADPIVERYGESVASLIEGNMYPVMVVGEDRRLEYAERRWGK